MTQELLCNLCTDPDSLRIDSERATVRSNVRLFRDETFSVWRCGHCRSIHACDPNIDLPHYYADYPFKRQKLDPILRLIYRNVLKRLKRTGLMRSHKLLDYGCGSGHFVRLLKEKGYAGAAGYDAFSDAFSDTAVLNEQYDIIYSQDVVEHVHEPLDLLNTFDKLVKPGGTIVIGTPNADAIDLKRPLHFIHALHQPYHTHIFSKQALMSAAKAAGWTLERYYPTQYTNTLVPLLNLRFGLEYSRRFDDTIDLAFDPVRLSLKHLSPTLFFFAMLGYFFCPETDIMMVFQKPTQHKSS